MHTIMLFLEHFSLKVPIKYTKDPLYYKINVLS